MLLIVITPGCGGGPLRNTEYTLLLHPFAAIARTPKFPDVKLLGNDSEILAPFDAPTTVTPDGIVHWYELAPAITVIENVFVVPQEVVVTPVIEVGVANWFTIEIVLEAEDDAHPPEAAMVYVIV